MTALNPLSSVDLSAIEQGLKAASLDQHRGYAQDHFAQVHQERDTEYIDETMAAGYQVLREPLWNKGMCSLLLATYSLYPKSPKFNRLIFFFFFLDCHANNTYRIGLSFTPEERKSKNLTGLVPHTIESLQTQCARAMKMIQTRQSPIDKYLYLSSLKDQNVDLFYRLVMDNIRDLMPLVYTPTIGDVCLQYSSIYTRPEALYISIKQRKSIATMLRNWPFPNPEICVVTDGSRILGLGDLGLNGVGISVCDPTPPHPSHYSHPHHREPPPH